MTCLNDTFLHRRAFRGRRRPRHSKMTSSLAFL